MTKTTKVAHERVCGSSQQATVANDAEMNSSVEASGTMTAACSACSCCRGGKMVLGRDEVVEERREVIGDETPGAAGGDGVAVEGLGVMACIALVMACMARA